MSRIDVYRWVDGQLIHRTAALDSVLDNYHGSIYHMLAEATYGMAQQGFPVYSIPEAIERLKPILLEGQLKFFIGPTWISLVGLCTDWHSPGVTLAEEIVGPRFQHVGMVLPDYLNAMHSLGTQFGATDFQVGTLAQPRKQAMVRRLTDLGMSLTTSIVSRRIKYG